MSLLEVKQLVAGYGAATILDKIDLAADAGSVLAVLGPNGVGKTTLLRAIQGFVRVRAGEVRLDGRRIDGCNPAQIARSGIQQVPEGRMLYPQLTVHEHLVAGGASLSRRDANRRIAELEERFPVLGRRRRSAADTLSGGQQQLLAIARALVARPRVLLLDEPSTGLAPVLVDEVMQVIASLRAEGTAVVLVEQNVRVALDVAERGIVIERGRVALEGKAEDLRDDPAVIASYLGGQEPDATLPVDLSPARPGSRGRPADAGKAGRDSAPVPRPGAASSPSAAPGHGLLVENIDVSFGGLAVLRNVSVVAKPGRITGIIGPNGAGKTTLFNAMSGFVQPHGGRISLNGVEVTGLAPASLHALGLGRTFQSGQIFEKLTVLDNLLGSYGMRSFDLVLKDLLGLPGARRQRLAVEEEARAMAAALGMSDLLHQPAGSLSAGLQKLVDIGRALVQQPQMVLLDEPVAGLREDERANMAKVIRQIAQDSDRGVVLVEHDMRFVMSLCEVVYVLHLGEIIAYGRPESVQQDANVRQAYLGTGHDRDRLPEGA